MNKEGRGVYKVAAISVRWLPLSVIQILSDSNCYALYISFPLTLLSPAHHCTRPGKS